MTCGVVSTTQRIDAAPTWISSSSWHGVALCSWTENPSEKYKSSIPYNTSLGQGVRPAGQCSSHIRSPYAGERRHSIRGSEIFQTHTDGRVKPPYTIEKSSLCHTAHACRTINHFAFEFETQNYARKRCNRLFKEGKITSCSATREPDEPWQGCESALQIGYECTPHDVSDKAISSQRAATVQICRVYTRWLCGAKRPGDRVSKAHVSEYWTDLSWAVC